MFSHFSTLCMNGLNEKIFELIFVKDKIFLMSTIYGAFTFTCIFNTIEFVESLLCAAYTCGKTGERKHSFFVTSYHLLVQSQQ